MTMLDAGYIKALEVRARWFRWFRTEGAEWLSAPTGTDRETDDSLVREAHMADRCLTEGDTFFMSAKFMNLVEHARDTVPMDMQFDLTQLQAANGWTFLERP